MWWGTALAPIRASDAVRVPVCAAVARVAACAGGIVVRSGRSTHVTLTPALPATVELSVLDPRGDPLVGMAAEVVLITDTGDEVWLAGGNLDQSGTVTFRPLRDRKSPRLNSRH